MKSGITGLFMILSATIAIASSSKNKDIEISPDKTIKQPVYLLKGLSYSKSTPLKEFEYHGLGLNIYSNGKTQYIKAQQIACINAGKKDQAIKHLVLRYGRYSIALFQFDTELLKKNKAEKVKFTFRPHYIERKQPYKISFHRILVPWESSATWEKPAKNASAWKGMKPGRDYEAKAFAELHVKSPTKTPQEVDGFTLPLKNWADGKWSNHGFVAIFSGGARQINISQETKVKIKKKKIDKNYSFLGGKSEQKYAGVLNLDIVKALILKNSDIIDLSFTLELKKISGNTKNARLNFYQLEQEWKNNQIPSQIAKTPLVSLAIDKLKKGRNIIPGFTALLNKCLNGKKENFAFVMMINAKNGDSPLVEFAPPTLKYRNGGKFSKFILTLKSYPNHQLFSSKLRPSKGIYVQRKGSKLFYGKHRLRLWGACRHDSSNLFTVDRAKKMGFNALRIWGPGGEPGDKGYYTPESIKKGVIMKAAPGTCLDRFDRFFAECKRQGLFIMFPNLHYIRPFRMKNLLSKDSFLAGSDPKDWAEWCSAFKQCKKNGIKAHFLIYFDDRSRKLRFNHARQVLTHKNKYTGTTYAEDEAICMYEISNENGFLQWMLVAGKLEKLPEYFKSRLRKKWCNWLQKKYRSDAEIKKAWGKIGKKENLTTNSYVLAPTLNEAKKYPSLRGRDFVQFMTGLLTDYNRDLTDYCRSFAPKGKGVNIVPFLSDTQFIKNIPWLYANNYASDINSLGVYIYTLSSQLTVPPSMYILDHLTVKDKPTVIYEINVGRPNPFRGELPYKVSLLASRQDWDGVFWHYFSEPRGHGRKIDDPLSHEEFLVTPQEYPTGIRSTRLGGISDHVDPAKFAAMAMAGQLFMNFNVPARKQRTIYSIGPKGYFSYKFIRGVTGLNGAQTFRYGAEISFDPKQQLPLKIIGPTALNTKRNAAFNDGKVNWDWRNGRVIVDLPSIKLYVGKPVAEYTFKDGIVLSGINTPFVSFCLLTENNSPLLEAGPKTKILFNVCFDSQNKGFKMDLSNVPEGGPFIHPNEHGKRILNFGRAPVVTVPVSFGLSFPKKFTATLKSYDFALRQIFKHHYLDRNTIAFPKGQDFFLSSLSIDSWGEKCKAVTVKSEIISVNEEAATVLKVQRKQLSFWNPLMDVNWNLNYVWTHQIIRDGNVDFSSISKFEAARKKAKSINISAYRIMPDTSANISIIFNSDHMLRIDVAFTQPPGFKKLVKFLTAKLETKPLNTKFVSDAFDTSFAEWQIKGNDVILEVTAKELQGTTSISMNIKN